MSLDKALSDYRAYFNEKIETHGATPKGVDYNGAAAQEIRFEQLAKVIDHSTPFSVIDYGCGYGALHGFLQSKGWCFDYHGFDMLEKMVAAGRHAHQRLPNVHFTHETSELPQADYVLAGSIFNNKFGASDAEWQARVLETIRHMDALAKKGFAFDILTGYSDADRMAQRPDLYFADPLVLFDFCKRNCSRNVALLHDYGLYDFTILVRKDG
ncbi:MAG TPA: class I SAM-dependent methyltransferase [Polyangiaceae bacterium]|nr:class I SAM-dependent methyltransferase [Polyangiaceae bacterium]